MSTQSLESVTYLEIYFADHECLETLAHNYAQSYVGLNATDFPSVGDPRVSGNDLLPDVLEDASDVREDVACLLQEAEENSRQFTPAEVWTNALNTRDDADDAWHAVEMTIGAAFSAAATEHANNQPLPEVPMADSE